MLYSVNIINLITGISRREGLSRLTALMFFQNRISEAKAKLN